MFKVEHNNGSENNFIQEEAEDLDVQRIKRSETYCVNLFSQVATDMQGYLRPCCHFIKEKLFDETGKSFHLSKTSPTEFFNSKAMRHLREKVNKGEKLQGCQYCYSMEKGGVLSMRQRDNSLQEGIIKKVGNRLEQETIYSFDLRLGNLCNLGCVMCSPGASSFLDREWSQHGRENFSDQLRTIDESSDPCVDERGWYKDKKIIQNLKNDIRGVSKLWLVGGEPLLNPGNMEILESLKPKGKSLEVEISSNITVLNKKMLELLSGHKTTFKCSIDGIGSVLEYIRYPSKFAIVDKNFEELFQMDLRLEIVFSTQVLNILNIKETYFWLKEKCVKFSKPCNFAISNIVDFPEHLAIKNLPENIKTKATKELEEIAKDIESSSPRYIHPNSIYQVMEYLRKEKGDVNSIRRGWKYIEFFDKIRKNSWYKTNPWIKEILEDKIV